MAESIIKIENLSKQYRLGMVGTKTLQGDIKRWWAKINGKEDPFSKIGESNSFNKLSNSEYLWALRDINLEIKQGEVLGIIGKNGAGKSTLLKIISRITTPTTGSITINGRIASLLEVGTGFHPELSGRENIFINGAILGMTKAEIKGKLDEIIDFSGVELYIDTPVKRYSSGMYVRLAFAVAAHLEPEILVVDEVLAVGDAEFQKKALGKMQDLSKGQGRTVLFVSHNMVAVENLCKRGILLHKGNVSFEGPIKNVIEKYLQNEIEDNVHERSWPILDKDVCNKYVAICKMGLKYEQCIDVSTSFKVSCVFNSFCIQKDINLSLHVYTKKEVLVFVIPTQQMDLGIGKYVVDFIIPGNLLNSESYIISLLFVKNFKELLWINNALSFDVKDVRRENAWHGKWSGVIRPNIQWTLNESNN